MNQCKWCTADIDPENVFAPFCDPVCEEQYHAHMRDLVNEEEFGGRNPDDEQETQQ